MSWVQTSYLIAEIIAIPLTALLTRLLSPPTRHVQHTPARRQQLSRAGASPSATEARLVAQAARSAQARATKAGIQGDYIHAMPRRKRVLPMDEVPPKIVALNDDRAVYFFRHYALPSDAYFDTFETDPYAAHVSHARPRAPLHPPGFTLFLDSLCRHFSGHAR